jgi:hypothetical protein
MQELGYVSGKNIQVEYRSANPRVACARRVEMMQSAGIKRGATFDGHALVVAGPPTGELGEWGTARTIMLMPLTRLSSIIRPWWELRGLT